MHIGVKFFKGSHDNLLTWMFLKAFDSFQPYSYYKATSYEE